MGPTLYTERLQLREWTLDDVEAAFQMYGDPEVMRFLGTGEPVASLAAQRDWLADRIERYRSPGFERQAVWAAVERDSQQIIGTLLLKLIPPTDDVTEIGWHLARRAWGKGYASEAALKVLRYGLDDLGLERIIAVIKLQNVRSEAVAKRIGMRWLEKTNRFYGGEELNVYERRR